MARRATPCLVALLVPLTGGLLVARPPHPLRADLRASRRRAAVVCEAPAAEVECLVVGAGISGSTLAHNLHRAGIDVLLAEARDYVGGNVVTRSDDEGFVWEEGPNGFAVNDFVVRMAYELGICLLYTSPSPRDATLSRMPSSA